MELIHIDLDNVRASAQTIRKQAAEYHDVLNNVGNLCLNLHEIWKGVGQKNFETQFLPIYAKLNDFSNVLDAYADAMEDTVQRFETADAELTKKIKQG